MISTLRPWAALAAMLLAVLAPAAASAATAPLPDAASLVLAPGDFAAGARVASNRRSGTAVAPEYTRTFRPGVSLGSRPLLTVTASAAVDRDAATAATALAAMRLELGSKAKRAAFALALAKGFARGAKQKLVPRRTIAGPPVSLGAGAFQVPVSMQLGSGTTLRTSVAFVQVDRVLELLFVVAMPGERVSLADVRRAVGATRRHVQTAFTVASSAPPAISGTAAQGQTLVADEGAWTGAPTAFSYAWSRCDAAGTCTPIDGATAKNYTVAAEDAGFALQVAVTGANGLGNAQASSALTAVVG